MQARYDPMGGLIISLPVYEGQFSIKLIRLIIKELAAADQDTAPFVELMASILQHSQRVN